MTSEDFININPFEYLEIDNECPQRILSCYILDNPEKFIRSGNFFKLKNKDDPFYYTIINDIIFRK